MYNGIVLAVAVLCLCACAYLVQLRRRLVRAQSDVLKERARSDALLETVRTFTAASRVSRAEVLRVLTAAIGTLDRSIDVVLVFVVVGEDMECAFAHGARAQYFGGARMRADSEAAPARAAMLGHGVAARSAEELCIPTDRAALAFPLVADGQTLAVVYCSTLAARLACAQALSRVMEQAAFPYKIAAEREADRITAVYDPLTGLYTPRAFRDLLREELIAAVGVRAQPLALWFIDTDHFKQVNDTLGHAAGDGVLAQMASLLRDHLVPERDVPARNGGDEFCAVLREVHKVAAVERANAFCDAVRVADFGIDMPITASIGVASYPYDAREASELLQVADSAMYHSKRAGRDCVSFATGPHAFCIYS